MAITLQTAAQYIPFFRYKNVSSTTWGAGGNTSVIADTSVSSNSFITFMNTSTLPAGTSWGVTLNAGVGFTITSTDAESSTLSFSYLVL